MTDTRLKAVLHGIDDSLLKTAIVEQFGKWLDIENAIRYGQRVLLHGPPGTGKSYAAISFRHGADETAEIGKSNEVFRQYICMDTPSAEIRGHYVPTEASGFRWHDGPATAAWRAGARLALEEIDEASGDCLTLLLGFLDDPETAGLTLPNNEHIKPAPGFSCVATTNQLPSVLPDALQSRFEALIHVEKPHPAAFAGTWSSEELRIAALKVIYLGVEGSEAVRDAAGRPLGLRSFKAIDSYLKKGVSTRKAFEFVLGEKTGQWLATATQLSY